MNNSFFPSASQELLLVRGYPGSGKNTFARRLIDFNYNLVEYDEFSTYNSKFIKAAKGEALSAINYRASLV